MQEIKCYKNAIAYLKDHISCENCPISTLCEEKCEEAQAVELLEKLPENMIQQIESKYEIADINDTWLKHENTGSFNTGLNVAIGVIKEIIDE